MVTTVYSRGTIGYRAPELLPVSESEPGRYNNKADIWSLGCILYQLSTGRLPFLSDMDLHNHMFTKPDARPTMQLPAGNLIEDDWQSSISDNIVSMLKIKPFRRPSADEIFAIFLDYRCAFVGKLASQGSSFTKENRLHSLGSSRSQTAGDARFIRPPPINKSRTSKSLKLLMVSGVESRSDGDILPKVADR